MDLDLIRFTINDIPFVKTLNSIEQKEYSIVGNIEVSFEELNGTLNFDFQIHAEYPLKSYDSESINFCNKELIAFNHVMQNGNICIHTSHSTNITEKLKIDFDALKNWIIKYYINKDQDNNYEHIIVNDSSIDDVFYSFTFTECEEGFVKGEFGSVRMSLLNDGTYRNSKIFNFFVQNFEPFRGQRRNCQWNNYYHKQKTHLEGFFYFLEDPPVTHKRFSYTSWNELNLSNYFLDILRDYEQTTELPDGLVIPLFLGYRTIESEIHWQVALMKLGEFPLIGIPVKVNDRKTRNWTTSFSDSEINWALTRNSSYKYFFGRGIFSKELTDKRILIIGIGAIGSMVAQTLTRGGCQYIDFIDHDIKEPENVCRSEYKFFNGITSKVNELHKILNEISPFINSQKLNDNYFEKLIKAFYADNEQQKKFNDDLKSYDLIIDCSTDNDLMYALNSLKLEAKLINISITNHAKELVCAFHPNIYKFVNNQFSNVLNNDVNDLYEPTGCWSPTFKASYNDINTLVQFALKHLNRIICGEKTKNNFVIQEVDNTLKIIEY